MSTIYANEFGRVERWLHRFAFATQFSQEMLADLEDQLTNVAGARHGRPVFICGLPRSGTTILLQILFDTGRFGTHTYQDMPFVMSPVLWSLFSRRFRQAGSARERAHGDGMMVSPTTPEAFEEILWKRFWPEHFGSDRIRPWEPEHVNTEFEGFFTAHMTKVCFVRGATRDCPRRYVSKNNANLARIRAATGPLADGICVVPYRTPVEHAAAMLEQHVRFLQLHDEDPFALRYMEDIGHHDFGRCLKPIDFDGWLQRTRRQPSQNLVFWLNYWIEAYREVLRAAQRRADSIVVVSLDRLAGDPAGQLHRLSEVLGMKGQDLVTGASRLRPPRSHASTFHEEAASKELLAEAIAVGEELDRVALS